MQSFDSLMEGWVFCGFDLMLLRWERGRTMATDDEHLKLLDKIYDRMVNQLEVEIGKSAFMQYREQEVPRYRNLVKLRQKTVPVFSDLIENRYRIFEGFIPETFYICDYDMRTGLDKDQLRWLNELQSDNIIRHTNAMAIQTWRSMEDAMTFISNQTQENNYMARTATATKPVSAPKTPAAAPKSAPKAPVAEAPKSAPKAAKEPKEPRRSVSSVMSDLIMAGKLTDQEIWDQASKEFGLDESKKSYVAWNRNNLQKKGMNPPGPVGGVGLSNRKPKEEATAETTKAPKPAKNTAPVVKAATAAATGKKAKAA